MKREMKRTVLKAVEKMVRKEINESVFGWPPICMGIYHQPKRPKK